MAKRTKIQKIISLVMVYFFVVSCASQIPPSGGPPDKIPPEIIDIKPANQTINFDKNYIEITFSEYVNKRSVQESIFISPNIEEPLEYDWSGKTVEIELPDTLRTSTTYTVTIGTDVEDLNNNNRMKDSFTFAFSTGDEIDKGTITGKVVDQAPLGVMIYAYKDISDTLNPIKQKPDYITQCSLNGNFKLSGLGDGEYRVFAMRDEFKDFLYNPTQDQFGVPFTTINLNENDSLFTGLNFSLQIEDTTKPRVFGLTMTDAHHLLIEFSEPIDSTLVTPDNFYIFDSVNTIRTDVNYFFKGKTKKNNFLLAFDDTLANSEQLFLMTTDIKDHANNHLEYEVTSFVRNDLPDTNAAELFGMQTLFPQNEIDFINGKVRLKFTDGFSQSNLENIIGVFDLLGEQRKTNFEKVDDATIDLHFNQLSSDAEYNLKIDMNQVVDVAGNRIDSVFTHKFATINKLDFSGLSGTVETADNLNVVVTITNLSNREIEYHSTGNSFDFNRVYPGKYLLTAFDDKNGNGNFDKGKIYPFKPAERFVFYPDTLELKARWPVGDVKLSFE